jgi:hypothetical protein
MRSAFFTNHESRLPAGRQGHVFNGNGLFVFRLTIKNLNYILWRIAPQVKRSSNEVLLEP